MNETEILNPKLFLCWIQNYFTYVQLEIWAIAIPKTLYLHVGKFD